MLAIPADYHTQNRRTRLSLLGSELVKPFDIFIGEISEDASHDILISYRDIMSRMLLTQNWKTNIFDLLHCLNDRVRNVILLALAGFHFVHPSAELLSEFSVLLVIVNV